MNSEDFKRIRTKIGYTQDELGASLGLTKRTVSRYENGDYDIPLVTADMMMSADIKHKNRVVGGIQYNSLPTIINTFDFVRIVNVHVCKQDVIILLAAEVDGEDLCIRNFMAATNSEYYGQFIGDDEVLILKEKSLTDDVIRETIYSMYFGREQHIEMTGIGFRLNVGTKGSFENDSNSKD